MAENRGVFRLRTLRTENIQGEGVEVTDVWSPPAPIATADASYMVGGLMNNYNSSNTASDISSQTDKITYSTSTTSRLPGSNLDNAMYGGMGMSSLVAMYSGGGPNVPGLNPNQTNVRKLTYSTGSWALLPHAVSGLKVEPKESTQGVGDGVNVGYFFGGNNAMDGTSRNSYTQKYTFAYDLASRVPSGDLVYTTFGATAAGDQNKAVVTGGSSSGWSSFFTYISKFTYADDTMVQAPGINLSSSSPKYKGYGEAAAANTEYIWYAGGSQVTPQGGAIMGQTTVSRLTMAVDSIEYSLPSTQLTYPTFKHGGVDNGTNGYFAGGNSWNNPGPAGPGGPYTSANKLTFSNGTMAATPGANLTQAKSLMQTAGPRQYSTPSPGPGGDPYRWIDNLDPKTLSVGYWSGGGGSPTQTSSTEKVDFNTGTNSSVPSGNLPRVGQNYAGVLSDTTKVLITGGEPSGGDNDVMKWTYATKTSSMLPGVYPNRRTRHNDMHSLVTPTTGYVVAGQLDNGNQWVSSSDKVTFATDTGVTVPGLNYSYAARNMASWGNVDMADGYAIGGERDSQPSLSTINKLTYATDTLSNIPANLGFPGGVFQISAMSSSTKGYLDGGRQYPGYASIPADVMKFTFATETLANAGTGPAGGNNRFFNANATGNSTHGYSGGGQATSYPNRYTQVRKLSFTTETYEVAGEAGSFNPAGRNRGAAFSQVSNGKPVPTAPTPTPTPEKSPLAGTAPNFGVAGGGNTLGPSPSTYSRFDKLDYSTETNSVLPTTANVGTPSYSQRSITSQTVGWTNSAAGAPLWKFVYATSTQSGSPASSTTRSYGSGFSISNKQEGYFGGGSNVGSPANSIDKFIFATSTASRAPDVVGTPSGNNSQFNTSNVGNQQAGYYSGSNSRNMGKYVYATSTSTNTPNKLTSPVTSLPTGAGSAINGYFIAGDRSTTDRINYATDTITKLPAASYTPSSDQTTGAAGHSSSDAGYTQGGRSPSAPGGYHYRWSNTRKLTYSTETLVSLPATAKISQGRNDYSGMSSRQNNNGDGLPAPNVL